MGDEKKVPYWLRSDPGVDWYHRFVDLRRLAAEGLSDEQIVAATQSTKARNDRGTIPAWDPPVTPDELADVRTLMASKALMASTTGKRHRSRKPGRS